MVTWRAIAVLAFGCAAGCALIANLGDEARLRSDDHAGVPETGPPPFDAGPDVEDSGRGPCGLGRAPNPKCEDCNQKTCCAESIACAATPRCVEGLECLRSCSFVQDCGQACLKKYEDTPELGQMAGCSGLKCQATCIPSDECIALGDCCYRLTD